MATKNRGRDDEAEDEGGFMPLKDVMQKLKQGPMNFGVYQTGDKEKPVLLAAHKRAPPEKLGKQAKKQAGTTKGAFGTMTLESGVLLLSCLAEDVPASLGKRIRTMLKAEGLGKLKARILLPGGQELADDDDDEQEDAGEAAPDGGAAAPDPAQEAEREEVLVAWAEQRPRLEAMSQEAEDKQAAKMLRMMDGLVEASDFRKAKGALVVVRKMLDAVPAAAEAAPAVDPAVEEQLFNARLDKSLDLLMREMEVMRRQLLA